MHLRSEMPVNMAMEEPRSGVIGLEPNRNIIPSIADVNYVTQDRVVEIVTAVPCTAHDVERMSMNVNRVLSEY